MSKLPSWARGWILAVLALCPFLVLGLGWAGALGYLDATYTVLLLGILPVLSVAQLPLVEGEEGLPRPAVYLSSGALILILGWLALWVGGRSLGVVEMGLGPVYPGTVLGWTLGMTAVTLLLLWGFHAARRRLGLRETSVLAQLLPRTRQEKALFALLSLAAGVGEELAYRGYCIPTLAGLTGSPWGAAVLSSAAFGALHAYQGWLGIARTGLLGFLLAVSFLETGSLWPAILAHAILDLLAGLVLGETLIRE